MIRRCHVDRTLDAVRRSGVADELELLLRPSRGGRPRQLRVEVFLAGLILTVQDNRALTLTNVHATLTSQIPRSAAEDLGTRYKREADGSTAVITIRQVRYMLEAMERVLAHTPGRARGVDESEWPLRAATLQRVVDRIIAASLPANLPVPTTMALDGTAIDSWSRFKRSFSRTDDGSAAECGDDLVDVPTPLMDEILECRSFDRDAGLGYRTRTWDNGRSFCFGFEIFAMVGVGAVGVDPDSLPNLTYKIAVRPSGTDVVEPGLTLLDEFAADGHAVEELLNDRAWSYKKAERWAGPLRERGIEQVFDLHPNEHGVRDYEGIRMVDGVPHCPAMPLELADIKRPAQLSVGALGRHPDAIQRAHFEKTTAEITSFKAKIAERKQYAFRLVATAPSGAKDPGKLRYECPAQAGKVRCANCPMSQHLDAATTPEIDAPPALDTAPACCTQRTVTIPGHVNAKLAQRHYWGDDEWIASFSRRTHVEGFFGNLKNTSGGNIKRGWCKVVGIVKTSLLIACAVAATNIALLRTWAERTGYTDDPLCLVDPPDFGFEELTGEEAATPANGPPLAA